LEGVKDRCHCRRLFVSHDDGVGVMNHCILSRKRGKAYEVLRFEVIPYCEADNTDGNHDDDVRNLYRQVNWVGNADGHGWNWSGVHSGRWLETGTLPLTSLQFSVKKDH
jgi:hypothetical protein